MDEATGAVAGKPEEDVTTGIPPISAVRLEKMSKAVRRLVSEPQHCSGTAGGPSEFQEIKYTSSALISFDFI